MLNAFSRTQAVPFSKRNKFRSQIEYRSHQILNKLAQAVSIELVAGAYIVGSGILITSIYSLIRYHSVLGPMFIIVLVVLALMVTVIIVVLVTRAIYIREESEKVYMAFQGIHTNSKIDALFWKSCRPVKIKVGSVGSIETHEFLIIMFESVVLNAIVNLLLNF